MKLVPHCLGQRAGSASVGSAFFHRGCRATFTAHSKNNCSRVRSAWGLELGSRHVAQAFHQYFVTIVLHSFSY